MTELCVMCGNVLPTESGSQVCQTCELTTGIQFMTFKCPECGEDLVIYAKQLLDYVRPDSVEVWPFLRVGLLYHCNCCGCDWSSEYTQEFGDESQTGLKRHFWG